MYSLCFVKKICLRFVAKEAGDDDLCDVGSVGTPTTAHTHHSEEAELFSNREKRERERWVLIVLDKEKRKTMI